MNLKWVLALPVTLAVAGCDYQRKVTGSFVVDGHTFPYVRASTETVDLVGDDSEDFRYTVTFPDGTTETTYSYDSKYSAALHRDRLAREWLAKRDKEPGISDTIAGPPENPANLPSEDSKGD